MCWRNANKFIVLHFSNTQEAYVCERIIYTYIYILQGCLQLIKHFKSYAVS